jgi:hypothetical protein
MMPDRNQIACAASEYAAAVGLLFDDQSLRGETESSRWGVRGYKQIERILDRGLDVERRTAAADMIVSINADVPGISKKVSKSSC